MIRAARSTFRQTSLYLLPAVAGITVVGWGWRPVQAAPDPLVEADIRASLEKAGDFLLRIQKPDGRWDPYPHPWYWELHGTNFGAYSALATWALLSAGHSPNEPPLHKGIHWILSQDLRGMYVVSMRLNMLAELPEKGYRPYLERDAEWLLEALFPDGSFNHERLTEKQRKNQSTVMNLMKQSRERGQRANSAYGVLGLWAATRAGLTIPNEAWKQTDNYWRGCQEPNSGGWTYLTPEGVDWRKDLTARTEWMYKPTLPMTAAGVATLYLTEFYRFRDELTDVGKEYTSQNLRRGLGFMKEKFTIDDRDLFYFLFNVERIGQASGLRFFGDKDWYDVGARRLLSMQQKDGAWKGEKGAIPSTAWAMLFLARGLSPVAIGKVQFEGFWNNRPYDIRNFADRMTRQFEQRVNWKIVNLDVSGKTLLNLPVLYIASHKFPKFTAKQKNTLREFMQGGGLVVSTADKGGGSLTRGIQRLGPELFGGLEFRDIDDNHPFYNKPLKVTRKTPIKILHNGVRTLWAHVPKELSLPLHLAKWEKDSDAFNILANVYWYSVGLKMRSSQFDTPWVVRRPNRKPTAKAEAVRLKYTGTWNPEPQAVPRFLTILWNATGVDLTLSDVTTDKLGSADAKDARVAFLTGTGSFQLSEPETQALKAWLEAGGLLIADCAGRPSSFASSFRALVKEMYPEQALTEIPKNHAIYTGRGIVGGKKTSALKHRITTNVDERRQYPLALHYIGDPAKPKIVFAGMDLTGGLLGLRQIGLLGFRPEDAVTLCRNIVLSRVKLDPTATRPTSQPATK